MRPMRFCLSNAHNSTQSKSWIPINLRNTATSKDFANILIAEYQIKIINILNSNTAFLRKILEQITAF